jgi:two-component system NtrC family sensor kinase
VAWGVGGNPLANASPDARDLHAARTPLWRELGVNLALVTLAVLVLNTALGALAVLHTRDDAAEALAIQTAGVLAQQLGASPPDDWPVVVAAARGDGAGAIGAAAVWDAGGALLAGGGIALPQSGRTVLATRTPRAWHDDDGALALAPAAAGRAIVGVRLGRDAATGPGWTWILAHGVLAAAVLAGFGTVLLRRAVVQPLEAVRAATSRIAAGDFGHTLPEAGPRELAELAASLNVLSRALADYRQGTAEQVARLEAANQALRAAQDALLRSEKLASVGQLAAGLAHELGNPLAAVRGYVELLAMDAAPAQADVLRRTREETERMHVLVRRLLDYARHEPVARGPVDLGAVAHGAVESVKDQPAFRDVRFDVDTPGACVVEGDRTRLHQALVNLLRNAGAAGASRIGLAVHTAEDGARIEVSDDGEGIAAAHMPRVFDPFFTTRPPGAGTGLGLAVVHRVVSDHGGQVTVTSSPGAGARFRIVLPRGG